MFELAAITIGLLAFCGWSVLTLAGDVLANPDNEQARELFEAAMSRGE